MNLVARIEEDHESVQYEEMDATIRKKLKSYSYPWFSADEIILNDKSNLNDDDWSNWCLPCHYFNYIAGTSTGG
jgi:hypothetical protein